MGLSEGAFRASLTRRGPHRSPVPWAEAHGYLQFTAYAVTNRVSDVMKLAVRFKPTVTSPQTHLTISARDKTFAQP